MTFNNNVATSFLIKKDQEVAKLVEKSKNLKNSNNYLGIRQNINSASLKAFDKICDVHFFGSRIIGLATDSSDLDVFIDTGGKYFKTHNRSNEHDNNFNKLVQVLRASGSIWTIKKQILRTAVPIIEVVYKPLSMNCDLNITNGLSTENSKLLAHLFEIQPEAVSLYHFIKAWMSSQGFEGMKGYTLCLLVLFYLQQGNLMPSIETVQKGLPKVLINDWEVQFDPSRTRESYNVSRMSSYKLHVRGFFGFYKTFIFESYIISLYYGRSLAAWNYKRSQNRKFFLKGLNIAGPVNQGMNCGIMEESVKLGFRIHCIDSFIFLNDVNL